MHFKKATLPNILRTNENCCTWEKFALRPPLQARSGLETYLFRFRKKERQCLSTRKPWRQTSPTCLWFYLLVDIWHYVTFYYKSWNLLSSKIWKSLSSNSLSCITAILLFLNIKCCYPLFWSSTASCFEPHTYQFSFQWAPKSSACSKLTFLHQLDFW